MKHWLQSIIVGFLLSSAVSMVHAQNNASHLSAANELYRIVGGTKTAEAGAEGMLSLIRRNPTLAQYEDVFRAWYKKVFASGEFEKQIVTLYANTFDETELQGLIDFYKTPLGKKALEKLPAVMQEAMQIGERLAQAHSAELQQMLEEAMKRDAPAGAESSPSQ